MKDGLSQKSTDNKTQVSDKRQKILDDAFLEMRKAQKKMNPKFLKKIRNLIKNSPIMIEKLGLKTSEIPKDKPRNKAVPKAMPVVQEREVEVPRQEAKQDAKNFEPKTSLKNTETHEKIDQAKNIDVISKLMEISPDKKAKIVKMLSGK